MIRVFDIPEAEIEMLAIRARGPGGQHVNKVSSAIHLRFDVYASSLPDRVKLRLSKLEDVQLSRAGVIVIKAQRFRSQEKNRADALARLDALFVRAQRASKRRKPTKPTRASVKRRLDSKRKQSEQKKLRGSVPKD